MLLGVGSRVIEREQRIEVFQRFLCHIAAHLLRLVQNNDRTVCLDNIDWAAGAKFIPFGVDDTGFFALTVLFQRGGKRLRVDDHDIDAGAARKVIQLVQVGAVVDEETGFLAVVLHKVVCGDFKGLLYALTDRNRRNDHDKLAPTVLLVQFEHRLDIDIGFARAGFHFNIKAATPQIFDKGSGQFDVILILQGLNVVQKLLVGKLYRFILVAGIVQRVDDFKLLIGHSDGHLIRLRFDLAPVTDIADLVVKALPLKDTHNSINRIGLILLYFEIKFHSIPRFLSLNRRNRVGNKLLHQPNQVLGVRFYILVRFYHSVTNFCVVIGSPVIAQSSDRPPHFVVAAIFQIIFFNFRWAIRSIHKNLIFLNSLFNIIISVYYAALLRYGGEKCAFVTFRNFIVKFSVAELLIYTIDFLVKENLYSCF